MMEEKKVSISAGDILSMAVRYLLCLLFPPLAVIDKGCGPLLLVFIFTLFGWLPGTILAILICVRDKDYYRK